MSPCCSRRTARCAPTCPAVAYGDDLFPSLAVEAARLQLGVPRASGSPAEARAASGSAIVLVPIDEARPAADRPLRAGGHAADLLAARPAAGRLDPGAARAGGSSSWAPRPPAPATASPPRSAPVCPAASILATAIDNILTGRIAAPERRHPRARPPGDRRHGAGRGAARRAPLALAVAAGRCSRCWRSGPACSSSPSSLAQVWLAALPPTPRPCWRRARRRGAAARRRAPPPAPAGAPEGQPRPLLRAGRGRAPGRQRRARPSLDRTQEAVVMFVDIVGFTRLSEGMAPADAMALLRGVPHPGRAGGVRPWRHGRQVHGRRRHGLLRRAGPVADGGRRRDPRRAGAAGRPRRPAARRAAAPGRYRRASGARC